MSDYEWKIRVKYSPDQPRVPAGSSEGGRWTSGGGGGGSDDFSGGGYQRVGFPGDSNQSQTGWARGSGEDQQFVGVHYSYGGRGEGAYHVAHGKPYESRVGFVVSRGDVNWQDYRDFKKPKDAAAYLKDRFGIEWDGEFRYSRPHQPSLSPARRMGAEQIAQAVRRGELTPEQARRIKI